MFKFHVDNSRAFSNFATKGAIFGRPSTVAQTLGDFIMRHFISASFYELENLTFREANNRCVLNWILRELMCRPKDRKKAILAAQVRELIEELDALMNAFSIIDVNELLNSAKVEHRKTFYRYHYNYESSGDLEEYKRLSEREKAYDTIALIKTKRAQRSVNFNRLLKNDFGRRFSST